MSKIAIGIIAGRTFEAASRVLLLSLRAHHPELSIFVLSDGDRAIGLPDFPLAKRIDFSALTRTAGAEMAFRYTERETAIALKPFLLEQLLERGFDAALYLDADMQALGPLDGLLETAAHSSICLSPHIVAPLLGADRQERELTLLRAGTYNGGVVGVGNRPEARSFLRWWQARLREICTISFAEALHNDQRWLDLVPGAFEGVAICRDPGINLGYWNMRERGLSRRDGVWSTTFGRASLIHYSGFDPTTPRIATRHAERPTSESLGTDPTLFDDYARALFEQGWRPEPVPEYPFARFDNGVVIPEIARRMFHKLRDGTARFGDPFRTEGRSSFFTWLLEPTEGDVGSRPTLPRLWNEIWNLRRDLQRAFPCPLSNDREAFVAWTRTSGHAEHEIDMAFQARS